MIRMACLKMPRGHGISTTNVPPPLHLILPDPTTNPSTDNPTGIVAGNQHWGHATSQDLYHWINQPIALGPSAPGDGIFSGSAVIDVNNTSGFFPNQTNGVVAIYTLNTATAQTQEIAYSLDDGYTFIKYAQNPVLDINSTQFRDPKVIWHVPTEQWVMVIAYAQDFVIGIYTSPDLKSWEHASNFSHWGLLGLQYECPNMVAMPFEGSDEPVWLMAISINPGAPLGGSTMQYFPGEFNGTHFIPLDHAARIADFAKDNYAGQFFYGLGDEGEQEQIWMGWASNWEYTNQVPTGELEGWRSSMTVPRRSYIKNTTRIGYNLVSRPYNLEAVYNTTLLNQTGSNGTWAVDYSCADSGALYMRVNVSGIPTDGTSTGTMNFTLRSSGSNESLSGGYQFSGDNNFWLNRGKSSRSFDNVFFTNSFSVGLPINPDGVFLMEGIVDRSILEMFLNEGERSATSVFFPEDRMDGLSIVIDGINEAAGVEIVVRGLKSAWAAEESIDGYVTGNMTVQ